MGFWHFGRGGRAVPPLPPEEVPVEKSSMTSLISAHARARHAAWYKDAPVFCDPIAGQLLADCGYLLYEHLDPDEITARHFQAHNEAYPEHPIESFGCVGFCLAVRHG